MDIKFLELIVIKISKNSKNLPKWLDNKRIVCYNKAYTLYRDLH